MQIWSFMHNMMYADFFAMINMEQFVISFCNILNISNHIRFNKVSDEADKLIILLLILQSYSCIIHQTKRLALSLNLWLVSWILSCTFICWNWPHTHILSENFAQGCIRCQLSFYNWVIIPLLPLFHDFLTTIDNKENVIYSTCVFFTIWLRIWWS